MFICATRLPCSINRKTATDGMLHKVGCRHVGGAGEWDPAFGDVARRAKVCHADRGALLVPLAAVRAVTFRPGARRPSRTRPALSAACSRF